MPKTEEQEPVQNSPEVTPKELMVIVHRLLRAHEEGSLTAENVVNELKQHVRA